MLSNNYIILFIIICIIFIVILCLNKSKNLIGGNLDKTMNQTIFVSIASYRDQQCINTLRDLYINAQYPENIYVGICQQNKLDEESCMLVEECIKEGLCVRDQIKKIDIDYTLAKGPAYARYYCSTLYNNEDYYLQIDSHINFVKDWDIKLINMYKKLDEKKTNDYIISTYPLDYNDRNVKEVPYICESMYNTYKNIPEYQSYIQEVTDSPRLTYIIAAGFLFMPKQAVLDVPFDPNLPYLFMGEETLLAARLWTAGYNIYSPNENLVYHDYKREEEPKVWNDNKSFRQNGDDVIKKVSYLLGIEDRENVPEYLLKDINKYGMGNKRTIDEYLEFSDLDLLNGKGSNKWCSK
jgi:[Skp1-protein]-hydroxyproline N-acetylglucosaminyltransferase